VSSSGPILDDDERIHRVDPAVRSWNESWFFSCIDLGGGPAVFSRVGVMPNQHRAMLWCFAHVDGEWLAVEESRLAFDDLDLENGVAYDSWDLQFGWEPHPPLLGARCTFTGVGKVRSGPRAGAVVPFSLDLACASSSDAFRTGTGDDPDEQPEYPASRFEQSLEVTGTVAVDGVAHPVRAGGHRDRSWGPRDWRTQFTLGDVQSDAGQIYFVGREPGLGSAYIREPGKDVRHLRWSGGDVTYDDVGRTVTKARLELTGGDGERIDVDLEPAAPSICFDMGHTCEPPEHWLYWRALTRARVSCWEQPARGWLEASRYGIA
jgi:hypothetical protein